MMATAAAATPLDLLAFYASTVYYRRELKRRLMWIDESDHDYVAPSPQIGSASGGDWSCDECGVDHTPQRRNGPRGARTMCNACGLRWIKRERRTGKAPPAVPRGPRVKKCERSGTCYESVLDANDYAEWVANGKRGDPLLKK